jgi:hypothetical protein
MFKYGIRATLSYKDDKGYTCVKDIPTFYINANSQDEAYKKAYRIVCAHDILGLDAHVRPVNLGYSD